MNIFNTKEKRKDYLYVRDILDKLILDKDVDLFVNPNTGECFVIKNDKSICIRVGNDKVDLLNHEYCVNKDMTLEFCEDLKKSIKDAIALKIDNIKKDLFSNQINLLRRIFNYDKK